MRGRWLRSNCGELLADKVPRRTIGLVLRPIRQETRQSAGVAFGFIRESGKVLVEPPRRSPGGASDSRDIEEGVVGIEQSHLAAIGPENRRLVSVTRDRQDQPVLRIVHDPMAHCQRHWRDLDIVGIVVLFCLLTRPAGTLGGA
jgi:hypothetical protein